MYKKFIRRSVQAFTLVEVLGATAVLATLATVSIVSIKDTVQAGQKAAAQRELQVLNSALQNFKSAGGVIPENATADSAIQALKNGVDLAGSEYTPLLENEPQRELTIAGEVYDLTYDPEDGFSYETASGEGIGFGGAGLMAGAGNSTFPFDITDAEARQAALAILRDDPFSIEGLSNFEGLKAAATLGYLSPEEIAELADIYSQEPSELAGLLLALDADSQLDLVNQILGWQDWMGFIFHLGAPSEFQSNSWQEPNPVTSLHDVFANLPPGNVGSILNNMRAAGTGFGDGNLIFGNTPGSVSNLSGLDLTGWNTGPIPGVPGVPYSDAELLDIFLADMSDYYRGSIPPGTVLTLSELAALEGYDSAEAMAVGWNYTGFDDLAQDFTNWYGLKIPPVPPQPAMSLASFNLAGSNISAEQLNMASSIAGANLSGVQTLAGFDAVGKDLWGVNFAGSNISAAQLQTALRLDGTDLTGLNLMGMNTAGVSFRNVNLAGAAITQAQLNAAQSLVGANLSNRDLSELATVGRAFNGANFVGSTITASQLNAAADLNSANLSGLDLIGLQLAGKNMRNVNFVGSTITGGQLNEASNIEGANLSGLKTLGGLDLAGKSIAGVNFSNSNITGEQLNAGANLGGWSGANLSNVANLLGLNTAGKNLSGVNFSGSGITVAQLNQSSGFRFANLSNLDISGLNLRLGGSSGLQVNLSGSNITIAQILEDDGGIAGAHLQGVSFTRQELQTALDAAGKSGWAWNLDEVKW
jgi:uncharacterized protein YjbI with pentapeptide repeats/type II secretory pathway pseudopilin PulG